MPATKEEIITHLAEAKARFESVIKDEAKSKRNIIANASMYSGSIIDYLEAKIDQINSTIDKINTLKEEIAGQESVELEEDTKPEELPLTAKITELRNELNKIAEEILEHLNEYYVVLWEYNVRITSKYYQLLEIMYDTANLPEIQNKIDRREKAELKTRFRKLREEYALFERVLEKIEFDSIDWIGFIKETVQPKLGATSPIGFEKSYKAFARIVQTFVNDHKETLELMAGLIEKQTTARFKKILQLADRLMQKAAA